MKYMVSLFFMMTIYIIMLARASILYQLLERKRIGLDLASVLVSPAPICKRTSRIATRISLFLQFVNILLHRRDHRLRDLRQGARSIKMCGGSVNAMCDMLGKTI